VSQLISRRHGGAFSTIDLPVRAVFTTAADVHNARGNTAASGKVASPPRFKADARVC